MSENVDGLSWSERRKSLLTEVRSSISYYKRSAFIARIMHRAVSLIVLVGAVLAPVTVAAHDSEAAMTAFGWSADKMKSVSLYLTLTVALAEGVRRIFRFDSRWGLCTRTRTNLWHAREQFLDATVGQEVGSPLWIEAFKTLRETFGGLVDKEVSGFFEGVNQRNEISTEAK